MWAVRLQLIHLVLPSEGIAQLAAWKGGERTSKRFPPFLRRTTETLVSLMAFPGCLPADMTDPSGLLKLGEMSERRRLPDRSNSGEGSE